jgi:hypothetical protein
MKSKIEPITYLTYAFYIDCLGRDASFKEKLTSYCFYQGTANAINSIFLHCFIVFSKLIAVLGVALDAIHD